MNYKKWFWILLVIIILETAFMGYAYMLAWKESNNDYSCLKMCDNRNATAYYYELGVCGCYSGKEIIYKEVLT